MKTKIKIGGMACNLEDMPSSFQNALKKGMEKESIVNEVKETQENDVKKCMVERNPTSIYRKMFGYNRTVK